MGSLSFIPWIDYGTTGYPGAKIKQEKQVAICEVLKQQPDCFFFTYCAQCGLAPLRELGNLKYCQEKQTKPSRQNKREKKTSKEEDQEFICS